MKRLGIDVGSTTIKCTVLGEDGSLLYASYERHRAEIAGRMAALLRTVADRFPAEQMALAVSGSAGMGIATDLGLPFVQEVYATRMAVKRCAPETNTVIELGGEDAKILFLDGVTEIRMNGSCAGGTGAFIDQMAELMGISMEEMDGLAEKREKIYTIASRCGVFAKSDIQPLLNQGARREDVCASIFYAVVNQTVAGLAQGRRIEGNVLYLGGPLTFFSGLRRAFDDVLQLTGRLPENSLYFVAMGAALSPTASAQELSSLAERVAGYRSSRPAAVTHPLFTSEQEYEAFRARHAADSAGICTVNEPHGEMFLGVDAGSTTVKLLLADRDGNIFRPAYMPNSGNPVPLIREYLTSLYRDYPDIRIASSAVTGYGENIAQSAFGIDNGVVETVAHFMAAKHFCPDVDFILDIGGQDIKCFRIRGGAIDSIFLNEACSSGCGSFLQTFAGVLGYPVEEFARLALFAQAPVDLGSRCTVFMNSSVKQAQKDGATVENISAGLSVSVVKNALYKVIRCANPDELGHRIVVQGGTFYNDAVLRAFEQEIGREVLRPSVAGLMGAYGAALYAMRHRPAHSTLIDAAGLAAFTHSVRATTCKGCNNHCRLTVNTFQGGKTYIAGNRCDRPVSASHGRVSYNLYADKLAMLAQYRTPPTLSQTGKPLIGIPMGLNMYDLLPFWHTLLTALGYPVLVTGDSSHSLYVKGQQTIPSDTVCYPAKLLHGHIQSLYESGVQAVFYPSMSYNVDEGLGQNHYNCPVVAYYPEVIAANVPRPEGVSLINGFIGVHDRRAFPAHFVRMMQEYGFTLSLREVRRAARQAYAAYDAYHAAVRARADELLAIATRERLPVIVLAGRPYHMDPEINHGIDRLLCDLGAVVLTEDSVAHKVTRPTTTVLNQWTYHSRLYAAATYVAQARGVNINLVQLVSFGCGVDAVTTDETRAILERAAKLYTQIKIDEITGLGAVRIRLRSLFAVIADSERMTEPERTGDAGQSGAPSAEDATAGTSAHALHD